MNPTTTSRINPETTISPANANKIAQRWALKLSQHQQLRPGLANKIDTAANTTDVAPSPQQYVIGNNDNLLRQGMEDGSIPSTVVDSGCTSGVGTTDNPCWRTGRTSNKHFILLGGKIVKATKIAKYPFKVRSPAQDLHIMPGITENSLLSTSKFAVANYITIFDKEEVNIYDANTTIIAVTRGAILCGFKCPMTGMWHIPLIDLIQNNNTVTVIVNRPPLEFLPARPPPTEAIHNVYELKTQPKLVHYYHAVSRFPTKPTWLKAIKNKQFASWPRLMADVVDRHYPDSDETPKGHGRKAPSGLCSTKVTTLALDDSTNAFGMEDSTRPTKKECTVIYGILDMEDKAARKIYTNQPGQFPKKFSRGNQYIMVLTKIDSDAILIKPMKNRTAGEMIRAY
jgi:hypothetical protein